MKQLFAAIAVDGKALESPAIVTENLTITNCQVSSYKMGTLLDGTRQPHPFRSPDSRSGRPSRHETDRCQN